MPRLVPAHPTTQPAVRTTHRRRSKRRGSRWRGGHARCDDPRASSRHLVRAPHALRGPLHGGDNVITAVQPQTGQRWRQSRDAHRRTTVRSRGLLNRRGSRDRTDGPHPRGCDMRQRAATDVTDPALLSERPTPTAAGSAPWRGTTFGTARDPIPALQRRTVGRLRGLTGRPICGRTSRSSDARRWPAAGTDLRCLDIGV